MDTQNLDTPENVGQTEGRKYNVIEIEIPYPLVQYLSLNECNLQNICRICLSVNDSVLNPLFPSNEDCVLANMFMAISEVQMSADDGLPSSICQKCQMEVMNYYEFKMKCVKSDYTLKSVLKGDFVIKEESNMCDANDNDVEANDVQNYITDNQTKENLIKEQPEEEKYHSDADYLEDLKDSIGDDEALCIVQDTKNNEKQITIIDKDRNSNIKELILQENTKTSTKKTKHQCTYCSKKFHKVRSLRAHIARRHAEVEPENLFPCEHCKEVFHTQFDLNIHGMLHTQENNWKCTECQKEFNGKQALRRHIQRHMERKPYPCSVCGKSFVELYALRRHARVHTGQRPEKKHACSICDKRFVSASLLNAHMCVHGGSRAYVCACGATFPSQRLLVSHGRVHSAEKPHACHHCGKRFRHESTRNIHLRTHTGERPYVCAQCGKAFIQKSNMTLHMRTHTGERPYSCPFCERKFSSGSTLTAHKRTHTGERPYSCKVCGKSFARVNMKLHMRLHTGERPHSCAACHKRFYNAARLRDHYVMHTGEKAFECAKCAEKFATKSQLIRHFKKHDKNEKAAKKGVIMMLPVAVEDSNIQPCIKANLLEHKSNELMLVNLNANAPSVTEGNVCTVHETPIQPAPGLVYQNDGNIKTEVILMDNQQNLVSNGVTYVSDGNYTNDLNLVTVNEGEVSISAASAAMDGTTVKLYQYDRSLLQIHTGGGQLTISRISSKMTTNF